MSHRFSPAFSAVALAVVPLFAHGQSAAPASQQLASLDPVVVTASRFEEPLSDVPAFAQVISKEEMARSAVTSVPEAINKLGNINVRSMLSGALGILADIDMRGFGASSRDNTLILVDGMRVSPIDSGPILWESIPVGVVERIEIIHGGGSVQYGDKAVGGVINIITRGDLAQKSSAVVTAGSYGTVLSRGSLVSDFGRTRMKIDLSANTTDGWRENSQAKEEALKGLLSHSLGGQDRVFVEAVYSSQRYHLPGGVVGEVNAGNRRAAKFNNVDDKTTTDSARGLIGLAKSIGDGWQVLAEVAYSDSAAVQDRPYYLASGGVSRIHYDKWSYDITPRLKKIWNSGNDSVFGLDYQKATAAYGENTGNKQNAWIENKSLYFMHRYFVTPVLDISGGTRRQIQSASALDDNWSVVTSASKQQSANAADLALTYRLGADLKSRVFIRANRSFRFSNTDEYWGWKCSLNCNDANPMNDVWIRNFNSILRPQIANTIEVGGVWATPASGLVSATVFQVKTQDEIRYRLDDGTNNNEPKIERHGASIGLRQPLSARIGLQAGLNILQAQYREGVNTGRDVPLVPEVTANLGATYQFNPGWSYRMNASYVGKQRYMDDNDNSKNLMPSYVVSDVGARYRTHSWEFDLQVRNAANKKYASYGGYNSFLTVPTGFAASYFYYPGDPRTVWLSARYRFN